MSASRPEWVEIEGDLDDDLASCFAFDLAELERLLASHAAFDDYRREHPRD